MEEDNEKEEEIIKEEEILIEDLNEPQKGIPPELEKMIKTKISQMSNGVFSEEEQEDIYDNLSKNQILDNKENGTLEVYLNNEIRKIIIEKLREKNKENESSKEQPEEQQKEEEQKKDEEEQQQEEQVEENMQDDNEKKSDEDSKEDEEVTLVDEENEEEKNDVPEDVKKGCEKLGVNKIKGYFYVNAGDLSKKVDNTLVNKYGNRVLMLEVSSEKIEGPNKYYGIQDEKMVVYGNEDQAVREVTGNVTKMGKIVEPLKLQEPKAVEYSDGDGLVINEQIDDNKELSVQEANNYREEMEELLEEYSRNIELLKEDDEMELNEKLEKMRQNDGEFHAKANQIALKYDISIDDRENIQSKVIENSKETFEDEKEEYEEKEEIQNNEKEDDEPDYFEVPGKLTH